MVMTEKELLYVQDALGHEQQFQKACRDAAERIQDGELRNFATQMCQKHSEIFQSFYNLL